VAGTLITDRRSATATYKILRRLGKGGMAEVFLAQQEGIAGVKRLAVVKKILPHFSGVDSVAEMLLDEARIAIQLSHPNVVQIYELGHDDDQYFIAMEFVDGCDLATLARIERHRQSRIPMRLTLRVVSEAAMGLDFAHRQKGLDGQPLDLVHRDISPHNIMCSREGAVKVTDFGIAKAVGKVLVTEVGVVKGKVQYMAPEQYTGGDVDHRADIFSLGVVLYQLTTGRLPRVTKNGNLSMKRVIEGEIPHPKDVRPDYPDELATIVMRALAHDREDRYGDCASLRDDLLDFARQHDMLAFPKELGDYVDEMVPPTPIREEGTGAGEVLAAHKRPIALRDKAREAQQKKAEKGAKIGGKSAKGELPGDDAAAVDELDDHTAEHAGTEQVSPARSVIKTDYGSDPFGRTESTKSRRLSSSSVSVASADISSSRDLDADEARRHGRTGPQMQARRADPEDARSLVSRAAERLSGSISVGGLDDPSEDLDNEPTIRQGDAPYGAPMTLEDRPSGRRVVHDEDQTRGKMAAPIVDMRRMHQQGEPITQQTRRSGGQFNPLWGLLGVIAIVGIVAVVFLAQRGKTPADDPGKKGGVTSGTLQITARPSDVEVLIDGAQRCSAAPCTISALPLDTTLLVTVRPRRRGAYLLWNQRVRLTQQQPLVMFNAVLDPAPRLDAGPPDAKTVRVKPMGRTRNVRRPPRKGGSKGRTIKRRPRTPRVKKSLRGKGKVKVSKIKHPVCLLAVDVRPGWAEVWFNGKRLGTTPLARQLPVGRHKIELKNPARNYHAVYYVRAKKGTKIKIFDSPKPNAKKKKK
jgi:serine/threonine protein kinase